MKNQYSLVSRVTGILWIALMMCFCGCSETTPNKNTAQNEIRIISLVPSVTQSIYYLGAQSKLVGCTNYCKTVASDSIEVVSSVIKPNIEKIVSLKPDLVLVSGMISEKDVETLQKFGIRVERFLSPKSFDQICSEFIRLGELVDKKETALDIVTQSKSKIKDIQTALESTTKQKILIQIGASPIYAVIPNTFMADYISLNAGENILSGLTSGAIGREFVVSKNPDVIFVVTMGIVGEEEVNQWKQFKQMSAVINNKIFILDSDIACQPTPITFVETLVLMNKLISD